MAFLGLIAHHSDQPIRRRETGALQSWPTRERRDFHFRVVLLSWSQLQWEARAVLFIAR